MTETEFQHECSRAELLGLAKPTWEEFLNSRKEVDTNAIGVEEENKPFEEIEDTCTRKEGIQRIAGGLDELNSILSSTQKKIDRFKTVCGSFSNVLKLRVGLKKVDEEERQQKENSIKDINTPVKETSNLEETKTNDDKRYTPNKNVSAFQKSQKKPESELDKLDSLINKAEKAELSLSSQNKQMRKILK